MRMKATWDEYSKKIQDMIVAIIKNQVQDLINKTFGVPDPEPTAPAAHHTGDTAELEKLLQGRLQADMAKSLSREPQNRPTTDGNQGENSQLQHAAAGDFLGRNDLDVLPSLSISMTTTERDDTDPDLSDGDESPLSDEAGDQDEN